MSRLKKRSTKFSQGRNTSYKHNTQLLGKHENMAEISSLPVLATEGKANVYDEALLERAWTQWQFGDWGQLAQLNYQAIESHPARAELALLVASAHAQCKNNEAARHFITLSLQWGGDNKLIKKVLISGVYNSLARTMLTLNQVSLAESHVNTAVALVVTGEPHLISKARFREQQEQLEKRKAVYLADYLNYKVEGLYTSPNSFSSCFEGDKKAQQKQIFCNVSFTIQDCRSLHRRDIGNEFSINNRIAKSQKIEYGSKSFEFVYRPDSTGDVGVIKQIFEDKQYEFGWLPQGKQLYKLYSLMVEQNKVPLIIDAGANIGASSVLFSNKFKKSIIFAIEPSVDNCELIKINCANKNVLLFQGALANKKRVMYFQDPGQSDWGFRVEEFGELKVNCVGVTDILNHFDQDIYFPLILKIDIEGGESLVFEGDCKWIELLPMIIIELHDWMLPGQRSSENFLKAITGSSFEVITRGENLFCFNRNILGKLSS